MTNVTGIVQNLSNGTVKIIAEGEKTDLELVTRDGFDRIEKKN